MIKATKLIYDFDREYARFNTSHSKKIKLIDKLAIINKAQNLFVEHYARLAEVDSKYRRLLSPLEEKNIELKVVESVKDYNVYEKPHESVKTLRNLAYINKDGCGSKELDITIIQTDDLNRARNNPNWKSSFAWEQVLGDYGNKGLYVWHESDFSVDKVLADYIRKPKEIHAPSLLLPNKSYIDWNGVERTEDIDCEFDDSYVGDVIINLSVVIADSTVNDTSDYQLKIKEILETSRLATI